MQAEEQEPASAPAESVGAEVGPIGLSRRDFAKKVGSGSAATLAFVWAAPKISTIRYGMKAAVGSPPPGSTTTSTSTTVPVGQQGSMVVDDPNPCAGTNIHIHASGFAPGTAVSFVLDSAANPLGTTTSNADGRCNVLYKVPLSGPFGSHTVIATGVKPGGKTLVLSAPVVIRTVADCKAHGEGSTVPGTTAPGTTVPGGSKTQGESLQQGSNLPFTGADSTDLALVGGAAALTGWALYGLGRRGDEDGDDGADGG
jgi:hypothetical protein